MWALLLLVIILLFSIFHFIFRIYFWFIHVICNVHSWANWSSCKKGRGQIPICCCRRWHRHQPPIFLLFSFQLETATSHSKRLKMQKHWVGKLILQLTIVCSFCLKAHHITSNNEIWHPTHDKRKYMRIIMLTINALHMHLHSKLNFIKLCGG